MTLPTGGERQTVIQNFNLVPLEERKTKNKKPKNDVY